NVFRHLEMGKTPLAAAVEGAREVGLPVTFSVLTTIAAFAPLVFVEGNTGQVMRVIPMVVIATLCFSLVESLFVLPAHLAHTRIRPGDSDVGGWRGAWRRFQGAFTQRLQAFVERVYQPSLALVLRWRYAFVAASLGLLLITGGLVRGGWIRFTFFPPVEADNVAAFLSMPPGTPASVTARAIRQIEAEALELQQALASEGEGNAFRHVLTSVGEQPFRKAQSQGGGRIAAAFAASHLGEVTIELAPAEARKITSPEIAALWRERVGEIPDARELVFTSSLFNTGEPINVQLAGPDLPTLQAAAEALKDRLRTYPGVFDLSDSFEVGKHELSVEITPEAQARGLALADLARQVRQAFYGEEVQRVQRGRDEVKVMVRYPEEERRRLSTLETMRIRTADGSEIPFAVAGRVELGRGFSAIQRVDQRRVVNVTADVDTQKANANQILADLQKRDLPEILRDHPRVRYSLEGQQQEQRDTMGSILRGFLFALLAIYGLLAIPFKSYLQPVIIMSAIPFGLIGAIWGHVLMGLDLTMLSGFGIVALTGVVVNDSLVMVDFINRHHLAGMGVRQALLEAGGQRFRPIVLTSLTTFVGLLPLLLERSLQAQFLIPM
ncbi:MAG: efflux RND transporter permease subunit, partial [Acidobacteria bacterium]|nr:efflux RND transporter permease subunit [Acidobacteriota bacterium]